MRSSRDTIASRRGGNGIAESWIARSGIARSEIARSEIARSEIARSEIARSEIDCSCIIANDFGRNRIGEETTPGVAKGATRLLIAMLHTARK